MFGKRCVVIIAMGMLMMCLYWPSIAVLYFGMPVFCVGIKVGFIWHAVCLTIISVPMSMLFVYWHSVAVLPFGMPMYCSDNMVFVFWHAKCFSIIAVCMLRFV